MWCSTRLHCGSGTVQLIYVTPWQGYQKAQCYGYRYPVGVCVCVSCVVFSPSPLTGENHHSPISQQSVINQKTHLLLFPTLSQFLSLGLKTPSVVCSRAQSLCKCHVCRSLCFTLYVLSSLLFEHLHITLSSPVSIDFGNGVWLRVGKGQTKTRRPCAYTTRR